MITYRARLTPDKTAGGFVVTFPEFDYGATQGETLDEALEMAQDLLKCLVQDAIDRNHPLPMASRRRGQKDEPISLSALQSAKAELYLAMQNSSTTAAGLAHRLHTSKTAIHRLLDLDHPSTLDEIESAFRALGKKLDLIVGSAA